MWNVCRVQVDAGFGETDVQRQTVFLFVSFSECWLNFSVNCYSLHLSQTQTISPSELLQWRGIALNTVMA